LKRDSVVEVKVGWSMVSLLVHAAAGNPILLKLPVQVNSFSFRSVGMRWELARKKNQFHEICG
jgi:hypothetical protein